MGYKNHQPARYSQWLSTRLPCCGLLLQWSAARSPVPSRPRRRQSPRQWENRRRWGLSLGKSLKKITMDWSLKMGPCPIYDLFHAENEACWSGTSPQKYVGKPIPLKDQSGHMEHHKKAILSPDASDFRRLPTPCLWMEINPGNLNLMSVYRYCMEAMAHLVREFTC